MKFFSARKRTKEGTVVHTLSPSFMGTVQYASLLHPTMIRIAFKSMQGVKSFAGRSTLNRAIPAKAGIQLNNFEKGGEAPFFSIQRPIRELALAPTGEWRRQKDLRRPSSVLPCLASTVRGQGRSYESLVDPIERSGRPVVGASLLAKLP